MRQGFAHDAVLTMAQDHDERAPGAAITVELCGHWEHEPPCPLAPHHTSHGRDGDTVRLRILFATEPENEPEVRTRIGTALGRGALHVPDGQAAHWQLVSNDASVPRADEQDHLHRLVNG